MAEKTYTLEEIMAIKPKEKTRRDKAKEPKDTKVYSLEEIQALPPKGPEEDSLAKDAMELALMVGEGFDRYTGAPTRAAAKAALDAPMGSKMASGAEAFMEQIGEPTKYAPTGTEVAESLKEKAPFLMPAERPQLEFGGEKIPQLSPEQVVGLAADALLDPTLLTKIPVKTAQMVIKSSPALRKKLLSTGGEKVLSRFMDDVSVGQVQKLMQGPSGNKEFFDRTVGAVLLENDLAKLAGKPNRLLDQIAGKETVQETLKGLQAKRSGGLLKKKSDEVNSLLKKLSRSSVVEPDGITKIKGSRVTTGERILAETKNKLVERSAQLGKALDAEDLQYIDSVLNKELKPYFSKTQMDMFQGDINPNISFEALHQMKQELGETLRENAFKTNPLEANVKKDNVLLDLYHTMKEQLETYAMELDPKLGEQYIKANADMSALMTIKKALTGQRAKEFKKAAKGGFGMDALLTMIGSGTGAVSAHLMGFNPFYGAVAGAGVGGASRRMTEAIGGAASDFGARNMGRLQTGNVLQGTGEQMLYGGYKGLQTGSAVSQEPMMENMGRSPQSIPNINPIVEDKLIPRSSEWVMQHPNTVRAKLLTAAPELAAQVSIALERKDMKTLQKVMPQIANMVPHVFEQDDYGIFDGKIIDPNMRALYSQKIMDDQMLDSIEKAEILDHLNRTNEVLK